MRDNNHISINGRLVKDATLKTFDNGGAIVQFTIAVNSTKKEGDKYVDVGKFFMVKHRGKNLDKLASFLVKGKQVSLEGYLDQDKWTGKDGQQNSMVLIVAEHIQLMGGSTNATPSETYDDGDFTEEFSEDIPF